MEKFSGGRCTATPAYSHYFSKLNVDMNILILAAGKGTRMKSALPKVLHHVGGQSMLARVVGTALKFDKPHVVVVLGHLSLIHI